MDSRVTSLACLSEFLGTKRLLKSKTPAKDRKHNQNHDKTIKKLQESTPNGPFLLASRTSGRSQSFWMASVGNSASVSVAPFKLFASKMVFVK